MTESPSAKIAEDNPAFPHIYFFGMEESAAEPPSLADAGGKGINLCRLTHANFPVPPGFVIGTRAYLQFIAANQLADQIKALAESIPADSNEALEITSAKIRSLFADHPMPNALAEKILAAYHLLNEPGGAHVAVRSSATAEDLPDASFAGQQDTYLNIHGGEPLLKAVKSCWGSLWTGRAVAYRAKQKTALEGLAMAVVVQKMAVAEAAGVMFTANPVTGDANEIVINATWGLGESLVSGHVTPDTLVVEKASGTIKSVAIADKTVMTATTSDGTAETDVGDDRRHARVLDDSAALMLAKIGIRIEEYYGAPQDIEWALAQGRFAILQARPVQGLEIARDMRACCREEIERLRAVAAKSRHVWVAHNLAETLPAPMPMTWDIMRAFMSGDGGFGGMYKDFGYRPSARVCKEGFLELICGRIYADPDRAAGLFWEGMPLEYDLDLILKDKNALEAPPSRFNAEKADGTFLLRLPGTLAAMVRSARRTSKMRTVALDVFEKQILPPYLDYVAKKRAQDLAALPTDAVIAELHERCQKVLNEFGKESLKPGFFGGMARAAMEAALVQILGEQEGKRLALNLTTGLPGDSTVEQSVMLYDVAYGKATLQDFIARFGHRCTGEMELSEPRWREDPAYLEKMLSAYRASEESPESIHAKNVQKRLDAKASLPNALKEWGGSSLLEDIEHDMRDAQKMLPYRENGKYHLMRGYETIRLVLLELARRWNMGGDVFFLHMDELSSFEVQRETLLKTIATRKIRWQAAKRLELAEVINSTELDSLGEPKVYAAAAELQGEPVAAGIFTGIARIVIDPKEARDIGVNYILVCPSTDPGWTALFVNARGLIIERGGVLSHGAIVARDFGIPAVVCAAVTRRIKDGSTVRVDGNRGIVTVISNP